MKDLILALDQGTTGTTALIIDQNFSVLAKVNHEFPQHFPQPGWVEHDGEEIWASVRSTVTAALKQIKNGATRLAAIGITNQRETIVPWRSSTGECLGRGIVWQDRRTTKFCEQLKKAGHQNSIRRRTGLVLDPYFSGSKMHWLMQHRPEIKKAFQQKDLCLGTIDSFLLYRLTHGAVFATDVSNASRTMLFNIKTLRWDPTLLKLFGVDETVLPIVRSNSEIYGHTAGLDFLPDGIPVAGMAGDQQAALFGQTCFSTGDAKCTYGTGSFLLMNTGSTLVASKRGLLTTVAWQIGRETTYALEGSNFIAGAMVQWLRDQLGIIQKSSEVEALASSVGDSAGVFVVPALAGLGAPYWKPEARGLISGLTRGVGRAHIARATLEGIALSQCDILAAMQKDSGITLKRLRVDGGAAANNLLMQVQSDVLGCRTQRPKVVETTAMGAALLAGLAVQLWPNLKAVARAVALDREFKPQMKAAQRAGLLERWHREINRTQL